MTQRIYNFSAGPAILPEPVIRKAQDALWSLGNSGIGVMEHSHRSREFMAVIEEAEALCRQIGKVPDSHRVLFLQGGASAQFYMVPMNLLPQDRTADYLNTGIWSQKAIQEARRFGTVHIAGSSEADEFTYIPGPGQIRYSEQPVYVHFTSNNTVYGTEFTGEPALPAGVPLVCDASSDIFSKPIDLGKYDLLYAGAQKNLGPSGLVLVVLRESLATSVPRDIPTMLRYSTHIEGGSMYNTPPTFAIYVLGEVLKWIRDFGGLAALAEYNRAKANVIYDFLDESKMFRGTVRPDSRSLMNICFRARTPELEEQFIAQATKRGLSGLRGHRTVGGMRASVYNAFPKEGCDALVAFMKEFEHTHA